MTTNPLTQFHPFPSLPYELRLKIYSLLLTSPRTLPITAQKGTITPTRRRYLKSYTTPTPIPPLLHTCHESRLEALTHYRALFHTPHSPSYIYANFDRDTIQLADGVLSYLGGDELRGIRRLVVDVEDSAYFGHYHLETIMRMEGLSDLELVARGEDLNTWQPEGHFLRGIWRDLREGRKRRKDWWCPRVRLVDRRLGSEFAVFEGGFWAEEDEEEGDGLLG